MRHFSDLNQRRARLAAIAIVAILASVALAGCSSGGPGATMSDAHAELSNDTPVVRFNYSVSDYSTVLLEDPNGEIVGETEISPNSQQTEMYLTDPQSGEYKLVLRQGDQTVTTESVTFEGADPQVQNVETEWDGRSIETVSVTISNEGDLPVELQNAKYTVRGQSVDSGSLYKWLDANETTTLELSSTYGGSVSIGQAGEVRGSVEVMTKNGPVQGEIRTSFEGPDLTVAETNATWSGNQLKSVLVTVRNEGDLPTSANASVLNGQEVLTDTINKPIPAGGSETFELSAYSYIYEADSGGEVSLDVRVDSPSGYVTDQITHEVAGADVSIASMSPTWQNGKLSGVTFDVSNQGEVATDFTAIVTVNGETVSERDYTIDASSSGTVEIGDPSYSYNSLFIADSGGDYDVEVTIRGDGWSDSVAKTKSLGGVSGEISGVDTVFYSNYDADTVDLSSVDFQVRNTGDIMLRYDSIRISLGGVSTTESLIAESEVEPGASTSEYFTGELTVDPGNYQMTIELLSDGEVVVEKTTTVSASS